MLPFPTEPMLAATARELPGAAALPGGATYEPKFDGYRALVFVDEAAGAETARVRIQSRRGTDITSAFPDIAAAAAAMVPPGVVLDGELVVWAGDRLDFAALGQRLTSRRRAPGLARERPATFMVFDVLVVANRDVRGLALAQRRELLTALMAYVDPPLQQVPWTAEESQARDWLAGYGAAPSLGVEGLVAKAAAGRYEPGRRGWWKTKIHETHDVVVGAVIGRLAAPRRLVLGYRDSAGRLRIAGTTSALRTGEQRLVAGLLVAADEEHPWPTVLTTEWGREPQPIIRVAPTLVVEVSADVALDGGRWRHQVAFVRARPEEDPDRLEPPGD